MPRVVAPGTRLENAAALEAPAFSRRRQVGPATVLLDDGFVRRRVGLATGWLGEGLARRRVG